MVRHTARAHKSAYLKFVVPEGLLHDGGQIESAVLSLKSPAGPKSKVSVRATNRAAWTESSLDFANAPRGGATIAALVRHSGRVSRADVTSFVKAAGTYTFQLSTGAGVSRFYSIRVERQGAQAHRDGQAAQAQARTDSDAAYRQRRTPTTPCTDNARTDNGPVPTPSGHRRRTPVPPAPSAPKALLGMSAPLQFWDARVTEVGSGLQARRLFFTSLDASISKAQTTCDAGMYPVLSFKTTGYTWAQVAAGDADAKLRALATKLAR